MRADTIQYVVWDWNGTLLDDTLACVSAINTMLTRRGVARIDVARYRAVFGFPVIDFYRQIDFPLAREDWDSLAREFHGLFLAEPSIRLQDGARDVLEQVRRRGLPQSILSASEQGILDRMLGDFAIRDYFTEVFGVDNLHGHSKMALGQNLLQKLALPPEQVLLVGDTLHDAEVAQALGARCILVAQGHQSASRLEQAGVPVVANLTCVVKALACALQ
ncbi:MAG: HAD family hydrolase [Kiritimatiellaeota bacterium]|nr:HAD family hydrolase [Kiritimatiellota bacterium]